MRKLVYSLYCFFNSAQRFLREFCPNFIYAFRASFVVLEPLLWFLNIVYVLELAYGF